MLNYLLRKFFIKQKNIVKKPLTIINENRESTVSRRTILSHYKEEKPNTSLSKYFAHIKGLNTIERNIYSRLV